MLVSTSWVMLLFFNENVKLAVTEVSRENSVKICFAKKIIKRRNKFKFSATLTEIENSKWWNVCWILEQWCMIEFSNFESCKLHYQLETVEEKN